MSQKRFLEKVDYLRVLSFWVKARRTHVSGAILDARYRVNGYEIILRKTISQNGHPTDTVCGYIRNAGWCHGIISTFAKSGFRRRLSYSRTFRRNAR